LQQEYFLDVVFGHITVQKIELILSGKANDDLCDQNQFCDTKKKL